MNQDNNKQPLKVINNINLYEDKLQKLKNLVAVIEDKQTSFADLVQKITLANQLVEDCKSQLKGIESDLQ